jgi:hypothetical protein
MNVLAPIGPLAEYFRPANPIPEVEPLPCEPDLRCPDPRPSLSTDVFSLRQRVGVRWLPRFGLYDPCESQSTCRFVRGRIENTGPAIKTTITNAVDSHHMIGLAVVGIAAAIIGGFWAAIYNFCPECGGQVNNLRGVVLVAAAAVTVFNLIRFIAIRDNMNGPVEFTSRYSGPIPPDVRKKIRSLAQPLIVADATWAMESPPPRPTFDPYLVERCNVGGRVHLHVVAWWNLTKSEVVIDEFITPADDRRAMHGDGQ